MPLKNDPLLEKLADTRDHLKQETKEITGRSPVVCTDDALRAIAKQRPLKRDDFKAIQGLGDTFIERYADAFLRVIYEHHHAQVHEVDVSTTSNRVLSTYKDRLSNLSRRNRNLFMGRLANRHSVDLWVPSLMKSLPPFMVKHQKKPLRLTFSDDGFASDIEEAFHRRLTLLYREVNRNIRERGSSGLFIATPFIEGKLRGEAFEVKAPLLFMPVLLKRQGVDFYLYFDHEKDLVYNRDLLLANQKASRLKAIEDIPDPQTLTFQSIAEVLLPFLHANHIRIRGNTKFKNAFEPFETRKKEDFEGVKKGELTLTYNVILTMAKIHTSHMQEDISRIMEKQTYNDLLEGLLDQPLVPYDYTQNNPFTSSRGQTVEESRLTAINDLNHSQEHVLDLIDTHDRLVIWGPPGTGKSQTITSLVAKQIAKGENVLVVSEKRVALDVIKNRLGSASPYAMFIDDAQDKQAFYKQVKTYLDPKPPQRTTNNDRLQADETINHYLQKLRRLHAAFYVPSKIGIPLSNLYERYLSMKKITASLMPERVYHAFAARLSPLTHDKLKAVEARFDKPSSLRDVLTYQKLFSTYAVLKPMNLALTRSEKLKRKTFYDAFDAFRDSLNKTWFFNRPRLRRRFIKTQTDKLAFWFTKKRHARRFLKALIRDDTLYETVKNRYHTFDKARHLLSTMSKDEHHYVEMLIHDEPFASVEAIHRRHTMIFDVLYTGMIEQFEAANQDKVHDIVHYKKLMQKLEDAFQSKRQMCEENFHMALYKNALDFVDSKRIMDIRHKLESHRKMSVKSFIDRYQLELFTHINVWLMTPEVVSEIIPLNYAMFDLVIFDEASQMFVEKAVPTIYRAKKVVIAGDTKQLRPSALGEGRIEHDFDEEEAPDITLDAQSLLDLARFKYKETILNYHYRSHFEELIAFSNHAFYDGRLIVSPNVQTPNKPPIETIVCEDGLWSQRANRQEAAKVVELLKRVLREKSASTTVGVITFNTPQRNLIEDMIDELLLASSVHTKRFAKELSRHENGEDHSLFVKNIENVQGDERDIIIFSTAYAKNRYGKFLRQFGWLNSEGGQNRLNVAITRARQKVYIVTSFHPAELKVDDLKSAGPKRLKQYLEYCFHIAAKDETSARDLLFSLSEETGSNVEAVHSTFKEAVHKRLQRESFTVESDVGIGKDTVDFALETENKTGKVGVVCDVNASHVYDVRDTLYHREKYLRARGWKIVRIFAPNWYKDANREMRTIRNAVKALSDAK